MQKIGKTPKQYANELVTEFKLVLMQEDTDCGCEILCTLIAVKNALITVDKLIKVTVDKLIKVTHEDYHCYYYLVILELKKM